MYKKISLLCMLAVLLLVQACAGMVQAQDTQSLTEVAEGFNDRYLGYIGDLAIESFLTKLLKGAYRERGNLMHAFVAEVDTIMAERLFFDPVPLAEDILSNFSVDVSSESDWAAVRLQFGDYNVNDLVISLVEEDGIWKINGIYIMN